MLALLSTRSAVAQTALSPDAALTQLMDGNSRFMRGDLTSFEEDLTILKQKTVAKQEPFAAVLSCADSRVPVELVFDQSIGHLFVCRVAGNICTPEIKDEGDCVLLRTGERQGHATWVKGHLSDAGGRTRSGGIHAGNHFDRYSGLPANRDVILC